MKSEILNTDKGKYAVRADGISGMAPLTLEDLRKLNQQYDPDTLVKTIIVDKISGGIKPS